MPGEWQVSEAARMAHVTVRTLHHYDEIGLLVPSGRTDAGYRLYSDREIERLHRILLYRELGFPLETIRRMLDEPGTDRVAELRAQREELARRVQRTQAVLRAVDRTLDSMERGTTMPSNEMFDGFEEFDHARYADEAEERWGDTDAYRESARRTKGYSDEDWADVRREIEGIETEMAAIMASGAAAGGEGAMAVAERAREHIERWFYPCAPKMHVALADMYEADPRFRAHYEKRAQGLASFMAEAIRANARRVARE